MLMSPMEDVALYINNSKAEGLDIMSRNNIDITTVYQTKITLSATYMEKAM